MPESKNSNPNKKNLPVDAATHEAYEKLRSKYNFHSYNELLKKLYAVVHHLKLDPSLPLKEIVPGTGKEFHLGQKDLMKLLEAQKADLKDLFIQHHRSEGEKKFFTHLITTYNTYAEIKDASEEKDKMITELRNYVRKLLNENKELKAKSAQ